MRALVSTPGEPGGVALCEVPDPRPGPGEAVVRVAASSLNRGELRLLATRPRGWRPGQDVAGVVERAADDGTGPVTGARVVALVDQAGWAEAVAVPTDRIAALPEVVDFAAAATLPIAGTTALRTLRDGAGGGDVRGRRVLVTGAGGAVGRFQVQLAALDGAQVTAVAQPRHEARLRELGALEVVPTPAAAPGPFDLITESVGGASLTEAIGRIAPGGVIVVFGSSSGEPTPFSFREFAPGHEQARLHIFMSYASGPGFGADLGVLAELVAEGRLHADVGLDAAWSELPRAAQALEQRGVDGKAVLRIR